MWSDLESEVAEEFGRLADDQDSEIDTVMNRRLAYEKVKVAERVKDWRARRRLRDPQAHKLEAERNRERCRAWALENRPAARPRVRTLQESPLEKHQVALKQRNVLAQRMAARKGARKQRVSK
jgi:hypothetical protein